VDVAWVIRRAGASVSLRLPRRRNIAGTANDFSRRSSLGKCIAGRRAPATLTAFTTAEEPIARIVPLLPKRAAGAGSLPAGGARQSLTLPANAARAVVFPATVDAADVLGWSADAIEAQGLWLPSRARGPEKACR